MLLFTARPAGPHTSPAALRAASGRPCHRRITRMASSESGGLGLTSSAQGSSSPGLRRHVRGGADHLDDLLPEHGCTILGGQGEPGGIRDVLDVAVRPAPGRRDVGEIADCVGGILVLGHATDSEAVPPVRQAWTDAEKAPAVGPPGS